MRFRNLYYDKVAILISGKSNQPITVVIANVISKTIEAHYKRPSVPSTSPGWNVVSTESHNILFSSDHSLYLSFTDDSG